MFFKHHQKCINDAGKMFYKQLVHRLLDLERPKSMSY